MLFQVVGGCVCLCVGVCVCVCGGGRGEAVVSLHDHMHDVLYHYSPAAERGRTTYNIHGLN